MYIKYVASQRSNIHMYILSSVNGLKGFLLPPTLRPRRKVQTVGVGNSPGRTDAIAILMEFDCSNLGGT
jgi:hypothetical protein